MVFMGYFVRYVVIGLILAAIALLGVFTGKNLRKRKDAKTADEKQSAE